MSWTDDIRCLYCDGRLPLYKKITDGQFCSTAHRKSYWQEHERLAVERLHQTHDTLRAYRPPGAVEAVLGQAPDEIELANVDLDVPGLYRYLSLHISQAVDTWPAIMAAEPLVYETGPELVRPTVTPQPDLNGSVACGNPLPLELPKCPRWLPDHLGTAAPEPILRIPVPQTPASSGLALEREPVETPDAPAPQLETMLAIPRPAAQPAGSPRTGVEPMAMDVARQFPGVSASLDARMGSLASIVPVPVEFVPRASDSRLSSPIALDLQGEMEIPGLLPALPPRRPRLKLATGRRYPVRSQASPKTVVIEDGGFSLETPSISLPEHKAKAMSAAAAAGASSAASAEPEFVEPDPSGLLSMGPSIGNTRPRTGVTTPISNVPLSMPQPMQSEPLRPTSKLEPLAAKPVSDSVPVPAAAIATSMESQAPVRKAHVWTHAGDFWKHAPRDLKVLAFAIPVLLGLALHSNLPKVRVSAPPTATGIQRNFQRALNAQFASVRQTMLERAAVALDEDFRSGLDEWASRGDATTEWSFDATGFVRPGPLALYRPSLGLNDYQMQFLGLIDKKALSWVVRAADFDNYYVVKLVVLKPGPLPSIGVTRYAVVNGQADARADTMVPFDARPDMLYRVRLDVHGDNYVLSVQGQMVDSWSEPRLRHGGVGFFSARGEESRVRWVQVTHQYDMLGRLCAYLAPYNTQSTSGGWQP